MQLYVLLKTNCAGKLKLSNTDITLVASQLNVSARTVRNNLKKLLGLNWIGYNYRSKYYFIRSFETVRRMYEYTAKTKSSFDLRDILKFKAFVAATAIGKLVNNTINKEKSEKRKPTESNKKGLSKHQVSAYPGYYQMSNSGLAKCLGKSKSNAFKLKELAKEAGYIDVIQQYESTGVPANQWKAFMKGNPEIAYKCTVKNGMIVTKQPDLVCHSIYFKSGRKSIKSTVVKK
ncbi:MAG: hypothetical protein K0Q79_2953 [Flavipsychrobacter sp.]|jgi:predicted transcriptional regulator|nr:hypothetical protein [Flavipsychrobacter sp.]